MADCDQVRMGASALMSALNALPWEDEEDNGSSSDSSEDEESRPSRTGATATRPKGELESLTVLIP